MAIKKKVLAADAKGAAERGGLARPGAVDRQLGSCRVLMGPMLKTCKTLRGKSVPLSHFHYEMPPGHIVSEIHVITAGKNTSGPSITKGMERGLAVGEMGTMEMKVFEGKRKGEYLKAGEARWRIPPEYGGMKMSWSQRREILRELLVALEKVARADRVKTIEATEFCGARRVKQELMEFYRKLGWRIIGKNTQNPNSPELTFAKELK